jgi:hypothetical protein
LCILHAIKFLKLTSKLQVSFVNKVLWCTQKAALIIGFMARCLIHNALLCKIKKKIPHFCKNLEFFPSELCKWDTRSFMVNPYFFDRSRFFLYLFELGAKQSFMQLLFVSIHPIHSSICHPLPYPYKSFFGLFVSLIQNLFKYLWKRFSISLFWIFPVKYSNYSHFVTSHNNIT